MKKKSKVTAAQKAFLARQSKAPMFDVLLGHAKRDVVSFHCPGHKNGRSIDEELKSYTGENVFKFDVTVFDEVDSLHDPVGPIKKSQELMAEAYGVRNSIFLLNGTSVGNIAMFLAACDPGDSVIVSRSSHKSIMAGVVLSGVWPIWIQPKIEQNLDVIFNSTYAQIKDALDRYPEAKAVFVTSPTYNGVVTELDKIVDLCHRRGKIVLVDEAHGPHLIFNNQLPQQSAVRAGADLCVQSTHKILSAFSQGSVLHFNSKLVDFNRVKKVVSMLQTTSPNYLTLATLDLARRQAVMDGGKMFDKVIEAAEWGRNYINHNIASMKCFTRKEIQREGFDLDVTKLTVNVTKTGLSGYEIEDILAKKYNIQLDYADIFNLVAIMGIGSNKSDVEALVNALKDIDKTYHGEQKNWALQIPSLATEMVMMPRDVYLSNNTKRVPLNKSVGHVSAQVLTPYPPGIPVLIPGERITKEICDYLMDMSSKDIRISGQESDMLKTVKVFTN
ncbi:aminotransferase class I/II-fold pyridoxal phosphate-dependent enzyme [Endomicrobium proavitum]|uniref:Arginine decarboxylase n=1 Tax=Endomicrobium proavitum TaxID=1408281 RepID=A0A0G3WIS4_9BACT|nr:aminotransferase class I/II-fold pyridoxal phosphate-dependent enzyme [Endomicrobium proavitum]AKL97790.1 Arginine decarboxylase [Endomicrobium proavitum]